MLKFERYEDNPQSLILDRELKIKEIGQGQLTSIFETNHSNAVINYTLAEGPLVKNIREKIEEVDEQFRRVLHGETLFVLEAYFYRDGFKTMLSRKSPVLSVQGQIVGALFEAKDLELEDLNQVENLLQLRHITVSSGALNNLQQYFNQHSSKLLSQINKKKFERMIPNFRQLTLKEKECLHYLSDGLSVTEVAKKMKLSKRTVETHVMNIKLKLESKTLFHLGKNYHSCL